MERPKKRAKATADTETPDAPVDSARRAAAADPCAAVPRSRTGGALFGAGGGLLPQWILACVLDFLTLTDVARLAEVGACVQTELARYYASTATLIVGSAKELAGAARLCKRGGSSRSSSSGSDGEVKGEPPLPVRVCARLRKLVVRNACSRYDASGEWNRASLRRQVASDAKSVVALLLRNSSTLTSLHMTDSLSASVSLALRECRSLVAIHAPMALSAMVGDARAPERWPQLRVATGMDTQGLRTLCNSTGLALTHVGPVHVDWCLQVLALVSHPLRVLHCTMDDKRSMLRALHAPPVDGCAVAAEELLRATGAEEPAMKWADEDDADNEVVSDTDPRAYAAKVPAAALADQLRVFHASLTALDISCESEAEASGPLDGSVELPAGVWRLRARGDVLRYFSGARGLRALSADVHQAAAAAALERVLRSVANPAEFALLELIYIWISGSVDDAYTDAAASPAALPLSPHAAPTTLLAAAALTRSLRVLDVRVAGSERAECVSRLAAARAWPALRSFHIGATSPWSCTNVLGATDVAVALQAWPALASLGATAEIDHFADRDEWLAEPDVDACVAAYHAHARRCDGRRRSVSEEGASLACGGAGGRLEWLQFGVDAQTLANPLSQQGAPWGLLLPVLTTLELVMAHATDGQRWAALSHILANAPCLESLTLVFATEAGGAPWSAAPADAIAPGSAAPGSATHGSDAPELATGQNEKGATYAAALRSLTIRNSWCGVAARLIFSLPALRKLSLEFNDSSGRAEADLLRIQARLPADTRYWWK